MYFALCVCVCVIMCVQVSDMNREDMIILGLQWSITDQELRRYFEQYGEVAVAEVNTTS